jgi:hypothetical protein
MVGGEDQDFGTGSLCCGHGEPECLALVEVAGLRELVELGIAAGYKVEGLHWLDSLIKELNKHMNNDFTMSCVDLSRGFIQ